MDGIWYDNYLIRRDKALIECPGNSTKTCHMLLYASYHNYSL